ncbi:hypothetical protein MTR_4g094448 [Medicago truncatula]|uniref:Uncharacterized protein n=1 Tax=Medicago truncatula TaxID=3880 RepID=G8A1C8_MEDTR|nr:hypothetical protein MTR_4g094448 [Medicago truncatula]
MFPGLLRSAGFKLSRSPTLWRVLWVAPVNHRKTESEELENIIRGVGNRIGNIIAGGGEMRGGGEVEIFGEETEIRGVCAIRL